MREVFCRDYFSKDMLLAICWPQSFTAPLSRRRATVGAVCFGLAPVSGGDRLVELCKPVLISPGPPILLIIWRLCLPETNYFLVTKAEREAREASVAAAHGIEHQKANDLKAFLKEAGSAIRANWFLFAYMVVLMAGFNSVSHGSQDLYPTFLKVQVNMDPTQVTVITVIGQIGALIGSTIVGYCSTFTGRRLAMMVSCVFGGALVPAYILIKNDKLIATVFFEQFFVGGVWGSIPVSTPEARKNSTLIVDRST